MISKMRNPQQDAASVAQLTINLIVDNAILAGIVLIAKLPSSGKSK